jgi:hypothetical protein
MHPVAIVAIVVAAVGVVALIVYAARKAAERERARLDGLAQWAHQNGFTFDATDRFDLDSRFRGVGDIGRGHARYAFEVLWRGEPVALWVFRYHFRTWETRTVTRNNRTYTETYEETHWRAYLIVELEAAFPALSLRPENWFDKVAGFVGFDDIDFESEQFSSRYHVKSADKQFAYAVIHPQMMEWLLPRKLAMQLDAGRFIMNVSSMRFDVGGVHSAIEQASGFINRIPTFVWQDYGKRGSIVLPEPAALPQ